MKMVIGLAIGLLVGIGVAIAVGLMLALRGLGAAGWLTALVAGGFGAPLVARISAMEFERRRVVRPSIPRDPAPPIEHDPNVDAILAKISASGLDSLSQAERDQLEAARRAKLRDSRGT